MSFANCLAKFARKKETEIEMNGPFYPDLEKTQKNGHYDPDPLKESAAKSHIDCFITGTREFCSDRGTFEHNLSYNSGFSFPEACVTRIHASC